MDIGSNSLIPTKAEGVVTGRDFIIIQSYHLNMHMLYQHHLGNLLNLNLTSLIKSVRNFHRSIMRMNLFTSRHDFSLQLGKEERHGAGRKEDWKRFFTDLVRKLWTSRFVIMLDLVKQDKLTLCFAKS